ncbi:hypothetical protein FACS189499_06720 [Clostridia bacterium]|nr:hypothetical protein FACS189499_06720 [Clostridia bacterium]
MTETEFNRVHDRWLEPPDGGEVIHYCNHCRGEIYEGEDFYAIDDKHVCVDCLRDFASDYFADCLETAER